MINTGFKGLMINELRYKPNEAFFSMAEMNNATLSEGIGNYSSIFLSTWENYPRSTNFLKFVQAIFQTKSFQPSKAL